MLSEDTVVATIAVKDMDRAKEFYEETLGLKTQGLADEDVRSYKAGESTVFVYKSNYAGGYDATVATWTIKGGIEQLVKDLKVRGVKFEHYPDMDMEIVGDIHMNGDMKCAWFKDPDGNTLCLIQE